MSKPLSRAELIRQMLAYEDLSRIAVEHVERVSIPGKEANVVARTLGMDLGEVSEIRKAKGKPQRQLPQGSFQTNLRDIADHVEQARGAAEFLPHDNPTENDDRERWMAIFQSKGASKHVASRMLELSEKAIDHFEAQFSLTITDYGRWTIDQSPIASFANLDTGEARTSARLAVTLTAVSVFAATSGYIPRGTLGLDAVDPLWIRIGIGAVVLSTVGANWINNAEFRARVWESFRKARDEYRQKRSDADFSRVELERLALAADLRNVDRGVVTQRRLYRNGCLRGFGAAYGPLGVAGVCLIALVIAQCRAPTSEGPVPSSPALQPSSAKAK